MYIITATRVTLVTLLAGILCLLGAASPAFAQDYQDWKFTHPKPQPNLLRKHQMIDANTWVAVGANGTFMRTTDAGLNWYFHHQAGLPANTALAIGNNYDVRFVNGTTGIVAGDRGFIGKTTDGGVTFTSIPSGVPTSQRCQSISFADATTGYIAGASGSGFGGTISKTTDGGSSWTSVYTTSAAAVNALVAIDPMTVHVVLSDGSIIHTVNGGLSWSTPVPQTVAQSMLGMSFLDAMTGFVVGSNGAGSKTTDGGTTWQPLPTLQTDWPFFQMKIISAVEIYAVGSPSFLYKSTDLGDSWTALPIPPVAGPSDTFIWYSLEKQGSLMTMSGDLGVVAKSTNGGASWSSDHFNLSTQIMFDIEEVPNTGTVVAVGRQRGSMQRQVFRSVNMGNNWTAIDVPVATDLQAVSFVDSQIGYACGTNSQVVKTTDAGLTWAAVTRPHLTNYTLQALEFVDANTGWVFVNFANVPGGNIFKTTDGGTTWNQQTLGVTEQRIASADMVDANVGYLSLNPSGQPIYKTTNGGITWSPVTTPFTSQITKVRAVDANLVYIGVSFGSGNNRVGKSTDGGASWTQIALPAAVDVISLDFKDANTGYVCGNLTTAICKTTDGGASWALQNAHLGTLGTVYAGPSGTGWALGTSTSILRWQAVALPTPTPTPGTPTATPSPSLMPTTPTPTPTPSPSPTPSVTPTPPPPVCSFSQGFDDITTLPSLGWFTRNNSNPLGTSGWFQGNTVVFNSQQGNPNSYIGANFLNGANLATISDWLLTPPITLQNGAVFSFWTRTVDGQHPDRLQVRMSTNGNSNNVGTLSTDVGDFTTSLLDINPNYTTTEYPLGWTKFTLTLTGIASPTQGRLAFRYFVENGGPAGANSDYIGIDSVSYACNGATPTPTPSPVCTLTQAFDDVTTLEPLGWVEQNNSSPIGTIGWFQGSSDVFTSQQGNPDSYIGANYNSGSALATISNWLLLPPITVQNGATLSFWTRTTDAQQFPDRLQVRLSTNGSSSNVGSAATDVGDFTTLLLDINPTYLTSGYPIVWTQFNVTLSGIGLPTTGRIAFRYFVESGGPNGANSNYIGIDTVSYLCTGANPTPTPTPSPSPTYSISGTIGQCNTSGPSGTLLPGVTMSLTGAASSSTTTDGSGNYSFSGLFGGNYTITPSKAARLPGSAGINTTDVIAIQRHFLALGTPLTGCRLTAADCAAPVGITTGDVIAAQRFFLLFTTGIGNVGKYQFSPVSRAYTPLSGNQTAQNFDTIVFGDVATPFAFPRPAGPPPADEPVVVNNTSVTLPNVSSNQSKSNFTAPVKTSKIDAKSNIVGFEGDFLFDERIVTLSDSERPVQNAGLTAGNWNVSGHVLPGTGPIRALRVSAYSTNFRPLEGAGTLFDLRVEQVNAKAKDGPLIWAALPANFIFITSDLQIQRPSNTFHGSVAPAQR